MSLGSRTLIQPYSFPLNALAEQGMKLGTEIHLVTKDDAQFVGKRKVAQSDAAQSTGFEFREYIQVTSHRIEIVAQSRTKE